MMSLNLLLPQNQNLYCSLLFKFLLLKRCELRVNEYDIDVFVFLNEVTKLIESSLSQESATVDLSDLHQTALSY